MYVFILLLILASAASDITIKGTNVGQVSENDISMIFFITVFNGDCKKFHVHANKCECTEQLFGKDRDKEMVSLVGGYMGLLEENQTKTISIIAPSLYLNHRSGWCTVKLQFTAFDNENEITSNTAKVAYDTKSGTMGDACDTIDLSRDSDCEPVDCQIKYLGTRNFFNTKWNRCQKVPLCASSNKKIMPDVFYSPFSNTCVDSSNAINKNDLKKLERSEACFINETALINTLKCHHGTFDEELQVCKCFRGWTSSPQSEYFTPGVSIYHMCNIQEALWYESNFSHLGLTAMTIGIVAVLIVICIIFISCILHLIYSMAMKKVAKNNQKLSEVKVDEEKNNENTEENNYEPEAK